MNIVRNYADYGVKTLFVIDRINEYFSEMRNYANDVIKNISKHDILKEISEISHFVKTVCKIPRWNSNATVALLSSNTL